MQVKWLRRALQNLEAEADYIARDNPAAARSFVLHVLESVAVLGEYPGIGRPGRVYGTRELVISRYPYIVPYRVRDNIVQLLRVFHTARKWPGSL
jgi:toxin ParE1/3/4